jgi:apolipoprotein N-acyltransferase
MYPFSPVEGALWSDQKEVFNKKILVASQTSFNTWLEPLVPTSTTVMIWTTLFKQEQFYNEFEFIRGGVLADEYRKRDLFPFIDYTPQWAKRLGFYTTQIDLTPGSTTQLFSLSGVPVFGLLCSEVQQQNLARGDAGSASILISAGSEAVFVDDIASEFSLKAAQFRAAENNIPAVRANVLGPSAIIARDGSVIASMPRGAIGVVRGEVAIYPPHPTLYTRFGNLLMVVFLCILFAIAGLIRLRKNQ